MIRHWNTLARFPFFTACCVLIFLFALTALLQFFPETAPAGTVLTGVFAWAVLVLLLVAGALAAGTWLRELGYKNNDIVLLVTFLLIFALAGGVFISFFFSLEQEIKIYDSTVYWIKSIEDRSLLADSILRYVMHLRDSLRYEYTNLAAFPLIPLSFVLGQEFSGYCLGVFLLYYLPACLFLTIFALRLTRLASREEPSRLDFITCFCLCALSVSFFWPVMNGYLDVVGALLMALLLNATLDWDGVDFTLKRNLTLAALSLLLLLTRRWYAYFIVGFYASFALFAILNMAARRSFTPARLGYVILNPVLIAGVSALCILVLNPHIFAAFFGKNYAVAYSAYKSQDLWQNIVEMSRNAGLLWMAAAAAGALWLLKSAGASLVAFRILLTASIAAILFSLVQDMGYHHQYLLLPTVLVLAGVFCTATAQFARQRNMPGLGCIFLAACALNFSFGYFPAVQKTAYAVQPLTTVMRRYPQQEKDYGLIRRIVTDLQNRLQGTSYLVYVVGDGKPLSPERLKRSFLPEQTDAAPFVLENNIVDLRDGFPSQLFLAEYILLSDTFRTSFTVPQQVSYQVHDLLLHDADFASYYRLEKIYHGGEEDFLLYRRAKPTDTACIDLLKRRLQAFFPGQASLFEPDYATALSRFASDADYSYNYWEKAFMARKEPGRPFEMHLDDLSRFSRFSFAVSCWNPGLELVVSNERGVLSRLPLKVAEKAPYSLETAGSESITISIVEAEPGTAIDASFMF